MPLNIGYIELGGGGVTIRIYYDVTFTPAGPDQPLIDGPRGWCLDLTNTSGKNVKVTVNGLAGGTPQVINVGQGDPVTSGPASGRSRTAAQMAALGFTTRGNVGTVSLE
jgi:hypothetical protein